MSRITRAPVRAPYRRSLRKDGRAEVVEAVALAQQASALEEQREVVVLPDARFGHRADLGVGEVDGERSTHAVRGVGSAPVERERVVEADLARAHDDRSRLDRTPVTEACELRVAIGAEEVARAG